MDLNFKDNWVGNIYQKFEAICQDVDDFVSKDTVKHVQNAGETVKKFYSGVVGDIIPPLVDPLKHAAQVVPQKQIDSIGAYAKSMMGIQEKFVAIDKKQSSADVGPFEGISPPELKNMSETFLHSKLDTEKIRSEPEVNVSPVTIVDQESKLLEKVEMQWNWSSDGDDWEYHAAHGGVGANMDSHIAVDDKNVAQERSLKENPRSLNLKNLVKASLPGDTVDENRSNVILSEVFLGSKPITENTSSGTEANVSVATTVDDQDIWNWSWSSDCDDSVYETACTGAKANVDSNIGAHDKNVMEERSSNEDSSSPKHKIMAEASICSVAIDEINNYGILAKVSLSTLVDDLEFRSSQEEGALCVSCLDEVECDSNNSSSIRNPELEFSVVSCANEETSYVYSQSFENSSKEADTICGAPTDAIGCFSEFHGASSSSQSFPDQAFDNKCADTAIKFDEPLCVAESSGIKHQLYCRYVPFEAILSSSEAGAEDSSTIDVADPSLEIIDLSDKVTPDKSCSIVEDNPVYTFSCRARRHRSYKKIIQDAFSSRKRLTKEYKQLAILYGDIDIVSSPQPEQDSLPNNSTISPELKKSATGDLCDGEWELL